MSFGVGWFKWRSKDSSEWKDSRDMRIWVAKMPPVTKPEEKSEFMDVPGRPRFFTLKEGEFAYRPYLKEVVILVPLHVIKLSDIQPNTAFANPLYENDPTTYAHLTAIHEWLRGDGYLQLSTEEGYRYRGYVAGKIEFKRVGNAWFQATVPFYVRPERLSLTSTRFQFDSEDGGALDESLEVLGNDETPPIMYVSRKHATDTEPQDVTLTITWIDPDDPDHRETQTMKFYDMTSASCHVINDAMICLNADETEIWDKKVEGDYFFLKPGVNLIQSEQDIRVIMHLTWRWI